MSVYKELNFESKPVRAVLTNDSGLYLCAYDLCVIVKRPSLLTTNPIFTMCASACKLKFNQHSDALWAIHPFDVPHLFRLTENENQQIKSTCSRLYRWTEEDMVRRYFYDDTEPLVTVIPPQPPATDMQIFQWQDNSISFKLDSGTTVNATQMAKAFGRQPVDWLKSQQSKDFIEELSKLRNVSLADLVIVSKGGNNPGTWMHEDVALEFARWLSPTFGIWCNDRIKELCTHGFTATPQTIESMIDDPDLAIKLFTNLKEERQAKEAAIKQLQVANQKTDEITDTLHHTNQVLSGLLHKIPLSDMRQRINAIIRRRGGKKGKESWDILFYEFDKKFHMNIRSRMANRRFTGNRMDFVETELQLMPELYGLTCKLFESTYDSLMNDWAAFAQNVESTKTNV